MPELSRKDRARVEKAREEYKHKCRSEAAVVLNVELARMKRQRQEVVNGIVGGHFPESLKNGFKSAQEEVAAFDARCPLDIERDQIDQSVLVRFEIQDRWQSILGAIS